MSRACSVSARRVYGKARVWRLWGVSRSTHYARRKVESRAGDGGRSRGRPPVLTDEALLEHIHAVLREAEALGFPGKDYRKVWARLRYRGVRVSKERVRHLMREHGLQVPHRAGTQRGPRVHEGGIIPEGPNRMGRAPMPPVW